jgi:hypothetical protein
MAERPAPMSAYEQGMALQPDDLEGAERVALAYIAERGDLPESIWYELGFIQMGENRDKVWNRLKELRAEHFKNLGQEPPPYKGGWI